MFSAFNQISFFSQYRYLFICINFFGNLGNLPRGDGFTCRKYTIFLREGKCEWDKVFKNGESKIYWRQSKEIWSLNPFVPNPPFLDPLKTSENLSVFWYFQGVEKEYISNKWVTQQNSASRYTVCIVFFYKILKFQKHFCRAKNN